MKKHLLGMKFDSTILAVALVTFAISLVAVATSIPAGDERRPVKLSQVSSHRLYVLPGEYAAQVGMSIGGPSTRVPHPPSIRAKGYDEIDWKRVMQIYEAEQK